MQSLMQLLRSYDNKNWSELSAGPDNSGARDQEWEHPDDNDDDSDDPDEVREGEISASDGIQYRGYVIIDQPRFFVHQGSDDN